MSAAPQSPDRPLPPAATQQALVRSNQELLEILETLTDAQKTELLQTAQRELGADDAALLLLEGDLDADAMPSPAPRRRISWVQRAQNPLRFFRPEPESKTPAESRNWPSGDGLARLMNADGDFAQNHQTRALLRAQLALTASYAAVAGHDVNSSSTPPALNDQTPILWTLVPSMSQQLSESVPQSDVVASLHVGLEHFQHGLVAPVGAMAHGKTYVMGLLALKAVDGWRSQILTAVDHYRAWSRFMSEKGGPVADIAQRSADVLEQVHTQMTIAVDALYTAATHDMAYATISFMLSLSERTRAALNDDSQLQHIGDRIAAEAMPVIRSEASALKLSQFANDRAPQIVIDALDAPQRRVDPPSFGTGIGF